MIQYSFLYIIPSNKEVNAPYNENQNGRDLCRQIQEKESQELKKHEIIPSIRNLPSDIKISVMTIKKAYDELENEGYIVSRQGKGTFVSTKL